MQEIGNIVAKADINLVDETFDVSQSGNCHLSIQTESDGLSFCVFNTVINKYIVLRHYPFLNADPNELRFIFENDDLLGLKYKSSGHLWVSPRSTLIPYDLFDADQTDSCLAFNQGATTGEQTQYNYLKSANLYNIFSCPETLMDSLLKRQPKIRWYHQTAPLIESLATKMSSPEKRILLFFYSGYLDILVVENKNLLFYNSFQINAPEDSVYYLVGVSNLFDINLLSTKLMYAGDLKRISPKIAVLGNYFGNLIECEPPHAVTYSYLITEPLRKNFINLFNLYGCES